MMMPWLSEEESPGSFPASSDGTDVVELIVSSLCPGGVDVMPDAVSEAEVGEETVVLEGAELVLEDEEVVDCTTPIVVIADGVPTARQAQSELGGVTGQWYHSLTHLERTRLWPYPGMSLAPMSGH